MARRAARGGHRGPAEVVFRWLRQFKVAPYSYDLLDNGGRRSPRRLTPGVEELAVGQPFLVFQIAAFETGRHLSGIIRPPFDRLFGPLAGTYAVTPRGPHASRLVVKLTMGTDGLQERIRCTALAWGDLIMMRKQLLTVKALAEASRGS